MDVPFRTSLSLERSSPGRFDLFLILPVLALSALGALMIYSASAPRLEALGQSPASAVVRQSIFVVVGIVLMVAVSAANERSIRLVVPYAYLGALVLLFIVLTPLGEVRQGAQRWLALGGVQLQPAELAKLAVILCLAAVLAPSEEEGIGWPGILKALGLAAVPSVLIVRQPDLGTMLVFAFVALVMLFVSGVTVRQLVTLTIGGALALAILVRLGIFEFHKYQLDRLTAFLDQTNALASANYNLYQSRVTIGSGGLFGKGLFEGAQTNLRYVPSQTTDFIFTAVGEQLGFLGGAIVILLYAVIVWRLLLIAANSNDRFGRLMVTGVAAMIGFHAFVNMGMTIGIMPVTGLPLPFMSQGGSAYLAMALSIGLANAMWSHHSPVPGERRLL